MFNPEATQHTKVVFIVEDWTEPSEVEGYNAEQIRTHIIVKAEERLARRLSGISILVEMEDA